MPTKIKKGAKEVKISLPELEDLVEAGAHFGHKKGNWHPKMEPFIFTARNGIHIINIEKTLDLLEKAFVFIKDLKKEKKVILFVGTKKIIQKQIKELATILKDPYVSSRWVGGTLTNFEAIKKSINAFVELEKEIKSKEWSDLNKQVQRRKKKLYKKFKRSFKGLVRLDKLPAAVFIVDPKTEKIAATEAKKAKVPIIAVLDTNTNPEGIDYPIPINDDSIQTAKIIFKHLLKNLGQKVKEKEDVK